MKLPNEVVRRVAQDFDEAELGDPRRTRRVARVVAKLARAPQATLPDAMGGEAELEAAYRLMNNPAVTFAALGGAHALCLPIACELLSLRSRARSSPPAPATEVLTPLQVKILGALSPRKLSTRLSVREALLAIAALGGHQRNNGEPGWLVLYRGMRKMLDYEVGWRAASLTKRGDL